MEWVAIAPANIAFVKYMGKIDETSNIAANDSLSYTLDKFCTKVRLEHTPNEEKDTWEPLTDSAYPYAEKLSQGEQDRFIRHLQRMKSYFNIPNLFFKIQSANNFPPKCGIASSASSFAALTLCAAKALSELTKQPMPDTKVLANLSRQGSGSSCRSLFTPWAYWDSETNEVFQPEIKPQALLHNVVLVSKGAKKVSSSKAHSLTQTSLLFEGRKKRAAERLQEIITALNAGDWKKTFTLVWQDWAEMHAFFETCSEPFTYILPETTSVLMMLRERWEKQGDGPLVTLDAGPNIHLLFREDQESLRNELIKSIQAKGVEII